MTDPRTDCLDADRIRSELKPEARTGIGHLTLLQEVDSTNSLLRRLPADEQHAHVVIAECQTAGRGRRQRTWHSPAGGNIYLSLGWKFENGGTILSMLPLVAAIAVCRALGGAGLSGHGIKWPNDILVEGEKLAGILVELQSSGTGPALAIIGVGINVKMPSSDDGPGSVIDRPWTDLASQLSPGKLLISRNRLTALVLQELLSALERFETTGFEEFRDSWRELDVLNGQRIQLEQGGQQMTGVARGIDPNGGLLLEVDGVGIQAFHSGEASLHHG